MGKIAVIGCGGTGSYLLPILMRSIKADSSITLFDGDAFTKENLDRQLFRSDLIGVNKALAMKTMYPANNITAVQKFLETSGQLKGFDLIFACPDNHVARTRVLTAADEYDIPAIICGNEFNSASATIYMPGWKGTPLDIRTRYPEILTDTSGSPTETSCTGKALESSPQLALANNTSAVFAMQLMHFWFNQMSEELSSDKEAFQHFPVEFNWAPSRSYTITVDLAEQEFELKLQLKAEAERKGKDGEQVSNNE